VRDWIAWVGVGFFSALLGALCALWLRAQGLSQRVRARSVRGQRGEERAASLLEAAGYRVVARQVRRSYVVQAGARELRVALIFDFVVEREGRELVAEVKTGAAGTRLEHADTRRQLLEYQLASGASQVLLVDPERERIVEVCFPLWTPEPASAPAPHSTTDSAESPWLWLGLCAVIGSVLWWLMRRHG
jgi:hypothetical protein